MGNRVPEVQSEIAMGMIAFVDDPHNHLDVDEKRLFSLHCLVLGIVRDRAGMVRKKPLLHCDGASRWPAVRSEIC
jgi:hypothetical protein